MSVQSVLRGLLDDNLGAAIVLPPITVEGQLPPPERFPDEVVDVSDVGQGPIEPAVPPPPTKGSMLPWVLGLGAVWLIMKRPKR